MSDPWYAVAAATDPVTQGDLIADCPLLGWRPAGVVGALDAGQTFDLTSLAEGFLRDTVVMSQACDLEHNKVANVVLCPALPLSAFRQSWEADAKARGQNPTPKGWRRVLEDIAAGYAWNQSLLAAHDDPDTGTEIRVVFFHELYTLPRSVLEAVLANRGRPRLRLLPPYREHLSQAFARFFMRVGLPQAVALPG